MLPNKTNDPNPRQTATTIAPPAVSVIVLTYNRAHFLDATVKSLLMQTKTEFELIIADDASSDSTQEICLRWVERDSRVSYHRRAKNVGMPANLNLSIVASTGKYVAILHDDDVYCATLLEKWTACLDQYPNAAFVFNSYQALDINDQTGHLYREPLARCFPGALLLERFFFRRWRFDSPVYGTVMMRRSAFDRLGPFDERYGFWSDVAMWMRLAEEFDVCYVDEPLIKLRSIDVSPHQFRDDSSHVLRILRHIFWEARTRHYRGRSLRTLAETIRHVGFGAAARSLIFASAVKRTLRF
jgi:glycosyltransferase involved in cell wall biosynthesis